MKKSLLFLALLTSITAQAQISPLLTLRGTLDTGSLNSVVINNMIPGYPNSSANMFDLTFVREDYTGTSIISFIRFHDIFGGNANGDVFGLNWPNVTNGGRVAALYSDETAGSDQYHLALEGNAPSYTNGSWSIGATTAHASTMLDVTSTTKGTRPAPTMTETQQNAISSPATGLMVFNSTVNKYKMYDGSNWVTLNAPNVVTTAATTLTMSKNVSDYVFTGSTGTTWTLPAVASTVDLYRIKNRGSANITINSNSGSEIYSTSAVSSITLNPGDAVMLVPDGTYFNVE